MKIEFDPAKREWTLQKQGLDLATAGKIFDGFRLTHEDEREDYSEARFVTLGVLDGETVVCVWTQRGEARRIISLDAARRSSPHHKPSEGAKR